MTEEDIKLVNEVHRYWFDGDQQTNYKTKWFPDGSTDLQSTADHLVNQQFGVLFQAALCGEFMHWQENTRACIALIVVLDQFSRHICRLKGKTVAEPEQKRADAIALEVSRRLHEDSGSTRLLSLSVAEYVFSLMPMRHTATVGNLSFVLECLRDKEGAEAKSLELLNRFRKQTVRKLQHLQDRARLEATADILEREAFVADESDVMSHPLVRATESFLVQHLGLVGASVGASAGFKGADQVAGKGKKGRGKSQQGGGTAEDMVSGEVCVEVAPSVTLLISLSGGVDSMVIAKILRLLQLHRPELRIRRIVAMHIDYGNRPESAQEASYVRRWCEGDSEGKIEKEGENGKQGRGVGAVEGGEVEVSASNSKSTSNSNTNTTSTDSSARSAMLGGLQCRVRRVEEVTRGVTNRDEYEKISRDIRYGFYRTCIQEQQDGHAEEGLQSSSLLLSGVIFGHHLGDVQENVISNVMRGSGPLQLSGMTACSVTNGVAVWRPLLSHTKDTIYEFAHRYGVPYFKDSTPSWSTRGKLRNQLVPLLLDMYGSGCLQNLAQLAQESDATRALVQDNLYEPFLRSVRRYPCGVSVNVLPFLVQPQCFWREALRQLMHSMNMGMVRDSAVGNFVERLRRTSPSSPVPESPANAPPAGACGAKQGAASHVLPGWLELRKGVQTFLTAQGDLVVLREGVFRKNAAAAVSSTTLNQRRQQALSQAKKLQVGSGALAAAVQAQEKLSSALHRATSDLLRVEYDTTTGQLSCDPALLHVLCQAEFPTSLAPSCCEDGTLVLGPWHLKVTASTASLPASNNTVLPPSTEGVISGLASVLSGVFSYALEVPSVGGEGSGGGKVTLLLLFQWDGIQSLHEEGQLQSAVVAQLAAAQQQQQQQEGCSASESTASSCLSELEQEGVLSTLRAAVMPAALLTVEERLRSGLPLLLPVLQQREMQDEQSTGNAILRLCVSCRYVM